MGKEGHRKRGKGRGREERGRVEGKELRERGRKGGRKIF